MTSPRNLLASFALVAVALPAMSACGPSGADPGTTTTTSATPSVSTSSPSPTSTSPEAAAVAAAEKIIPAYFSASDESLRSPDTFDREGFKKVAVSTALDDLQNLLSAFQRQGLKGSGSTQVDSIANPRVDLKLDLKKTPPDVPTVQLDVCIDVSRLNVVDKNGKSTIPADRKPRQLWRVGVSNYEYPKADGWRVSFTDTKGAKTC